MELCQSSLNEHPCPPPILGETAGTRMGVPHGVWLDADIKLCYAVPGLDIAHGGSEQPYSTLESEVRTSSW